MNGDEGKPRHLFTAAEAARKFGIPAGSIRAWRSKHLLYHYGLDARGNPMYDKDDLIDLRDRTFRRTQRTTRSRKRQT